jgi:hypothetical protein
MVDEKLPLPESSKLADPDIAARIHYATNGLMFEMLRLIRAAGILALKRNLPEIDLDLLRESFEENLANGADDTKIFTLITNLSRNTILKWNPLIIKFKCPPLIINMDLLELRCEEVSRKNNIHFYIDAAG